MRKVIVIHVLQFLIGLQTLFAQPVSQEWLRKYNDTSGYINNEHIYSFDLVRAMTNDNQGNVYIAGEISFNSSNRVVVIKYLPDGTIGWVAKYPQSYIMLYNLVRAITVDNNGNVYVASTKIGSAHNNFLTLMYNSGGTLIWSAEYDGPLHLNDLPYSIAVDGSGNVFVTGESVITVTNYYDVTTIKYNSSGVQQWVKSYDGNYHGNDAGVSVKIDVSGNIVVGGSSLGYGYLDDFVIIKYNQAGTEQWVKRYDNQDDELTTMTLDSNGYIYAAGTINPLASLSSLCIVKYSASGDLQWDRIVPPSGNYRNNSPYALAADRFGNVFVTGKAEGSLPLGDYITIKYNYSGSQQWIRYYDGTPHQYDFATDIKVDYEGSCYVTGIISTSPGTSDVSTVKYNSAGAQQWAVTLNTAGDPFYEYPFIGLTIDNSVYVGVSGSGTMDDWDFNLVKYHQVIGVKPISSEIPNHFSLSQNYPNPFNPVTKIKFDVPPLKGAGGMITTLAIYDILGREIAVLVNQHLSPGTYEVTWDASNYPSGVYFCSLTAGGASSPSANPLSITKKMVLVK